MEFHFRLFPLLDKWQNVICVLREFSVGLAVVVPITVIQGIISGAEAVSCRSRFFYVLMYLLPVSAFFDKVLRIQDIAETPLKYRREMPAFCVLLRIGEINGELFTQRYKNLPGVISFSAFQTEFSKQYPDEYAAFDARKIEGFINSLGIAPAVYIHRSVQERKGSLMLSVYTAYDTRKDKAPDICRPAYRERPL